MKKVVAFLLISLFVGLGTAAWIVVEFLNKPPTDSTAAIVFEVSPGESLWGVAERLYAQGLITSVKKFVYLGKVLPRYQNVRVGEYELRANMYPLEVLRVISSGKSIERSITFQEGLNRFEMAEVFERAGFGSKQDFLRASEDPQLIQQVTGEKPVSLEGYLFPETYKINKFTGAQGLVKMMVRRFGRVMSEISGLLPAGMSAHQVVTLASVIEKETGAPEERPLISSVFHNRLKLDMRLQSDPTVLYGIWVTTGEYKENITKADLQNPNPYNTYTIKGVPAGPIANPGRESLLAAVQPATSQYLYFVSRNDGTHVFSETYEAHQKAVGEFQLDSRAREGKSWRDLSKQRSTGSAAGKKEGQDSSAR